MSVPVLVLCVATAWGSLSSGPEELVARLGAARYADREAASAAIVALGRPALDALVANRDHPDLEVRTRVNALIVRIEGSLLLEPTPIVLDFRDKPVDEVIREINRRSGTQFALEPERSPHWVGRRVSLLADRPVPFWSAVDQLCEAARLQYAFPNPASRGNSARSMTLTDGEDRPPGPMSDRGPFRVNLMSLHYQRDLNFGSTPSQQIMPQAFAPHGRRVPLPVGIPTRTADGSTTTEVFYARMQLSAEPHLSLRQNGPTKLDAAVDDLGQVLAPPALPEGVAFQHVASYMGMPAQGPVQFQIYLKRPEAPGRSIRLLRGSVPVSVSMRKPNPLTIPLDGSEGKTFTLDGTTATINERKPGGNGEQAMVTVTIRPKSPAVGGEDADLDAFSMPRPDLGPLQLELADASGQAIPWFLAQSQANGEEFKLTLAAIPSGDTPAPPSTLRYFGTVRTIHSVAFEFRDVPMP